MSRYTEGTHDEVADRQNRLVKVGTKYNATAPSVADGDDVYLLVDSAGRILVAGAASNDAAEAGNPVQVGGSVDDTSPTAAGEGDVRRFRATPEGNQIVELYKDNNALSPIAAMPGASEVKAARGAITNSSTIATMVTPASGKKVRIVAIIGIKIAGASAIIPTVYFGTGANIGTNAGKEIAEFNLDDTQPAFALPFPDGGGPVGAADDVVSMKLDAAQASETVSLIVHYREE